MPASADDHLVARAGGGDVFAYTTLVERHLPLVYRTAYRLLRDCAEAEDVAQESFARLWQAAPNWKNSGNGVPAWLRRVSTNLCLDRLRRSARWSGDDVPEVADTAVSADRFLEQEEVRLTLERSLKALADSQRTAIVLTYYEGHSNRTSADIMGLDLKAFESLLHRARRKLGAMLTAGELTRIDVELLA